MARQPTKAKILDQQFVGKEPSYPEITSRSDINLTKALNWYSYSCDLKDGRSWLIQWMKENGYNKEALSAAKDIAERYLPTTSCWLARMANNGTTFAQENIDYLKTQIDKFLSYRAEPEEKDDGPVIDLRKRIDNKNLEVFAQAEEQIVDSYMLGGSLSTYDFLTNNEITQQGASYLRERYGRIYDEIFSDDEQVKEAYGKKLKAERSFWQGVINDLDRYIGNKKAVKVRKPRKVKEKPVTKIIENLKFQKEDTSYKIVSISPQELIGAQQLWTFNTKDRLLTVYHAQGPAGLNVKGTTLVGFDEQTSIQKRLRKPELILNEVLKAGKVAIKKIMPGLNTTEMKPTGRINQYTILLRVMK